MAIQYLFAAQHNQVGGLTALHLLAPPAFTIYATDLKGRWHGEVERVMGGDGAFVRDGLPWVEFIFPVMSATELQLLRTTYFSAGGLSAPVTIQVLNLDNETYERYNGMMHWPDQPSRDRGYFTDVILVVDQLEYLEVLGFDAGFDPGFGA